MLIDSATVISSTNTTILVDECRNQISEGQSIFIGGIVTSITRQISIPYPLFTEELQINSGTPQKLLQGTKLNLNGTDVYTAEKVEAGVTIIPVFPIARIVNAGETLSWEQIIGEAIEVNQFIPSGSNLIHIVSTTPPSIGSTLVWEVPQFIRPFYFVWESSAVLGLLAVTTSNLKLDSKTIGTVLGLQAIVVLPNPSSKTIGAVLGLACFAENANPSISWIYLIQEQLIGLTESELITLN